MAVNGICIRARLVLSLAPLALAACATAPVGAGQAISARIEKGVGAPALWPQNSAEESERRQSVKAALAAPMTPESAIRIALANNPRVIAAFEDLGVARADYLETVLPPNPALGALRLYPQNGGGSGVITYSASLDLLGLLSLPTNVHVGAANRDVAKAGATRELLHIAGEARAAMIAFIAARQNADLMEQAGDAAGAAADTAQTLFEAGNVAKVDRDRERLFAEEIGLENAQAQAALTPARERVNVLLGLSGADAVAWISDPRLPAPPSEAVAVEGVEDRVVQASTDVAIAAGALDAARARNRFSWPTSLLPGLTVSGEKERDGGDWRSGPGLQLLAPIFDLGGRERLRLASLARRNQAIARAIDIELRAEARSRAAAAEAARQRAVRRREVLLPLSADVFEGAQRDYNAMQIGILQLIDAKRQRLETGRAAVEAVRDYWLAQADLDLLLSGAAPGGSLSSPNTAAQTRRTSDR